MDNALYYKVWEAPKSLGNRNFSIFILVLGDSLWYMLSTLTETPSDCVGCVGMANQNMLISNSTNSTLAKQLLLSYIKQSTESIKKSQDSEWSYEV